MAARSIGSGTISFGLVSIPIRVYVATHSEQLSFNMLHESCGTRVRQQLFCPHHEKVIGRDETGGEPKVRPNELQMAERLIEQLTSDDFDPKKYKDEYRERLQEVVQQKVAGEEVRVAEPEQPKAQVIDLMEALKASLARSGG